MILHIQIQGEWFCFVIGLCLFEINSFKCLLFQEPLQDKVTSETDTVHLPVEKPGSFKKDKASVKEVKRSKSKNLVQNMIESGLVQAKKVLSKLHSKQSKSEIRNKKTIQKKLITVASEEDNFHGFTDHEIETASLKSGKSSASRGSSKKFVKAIKASSKKKIISKKRDDKDEEFFRGFTDNEIETASLKSGRSSNFSGSSKSTKSSKSSKASKKSNNTVSNPVKELNTEPVVLGKRKWKPSQRAKDNNETPNSKVSLGSPKSKAEKSETAKSSKSKKEHKTEYDHAVSLESSAKLYAEAVSLGNEDKSVENILKSQAKGKIKNEKKKLESAPIIESKKVVLKESVLAVKSRPDPTSSQPKSYQIDEPLLHKNKKLGSERFAEKAQKFLLGNGKIPSFVKDNEQNLVDIIGCALVDKTVTAKTKKFEGHIICGVCGYSLYCRDVRKFRHFGVFLCSACRDFAVKFSENPAIDFNNESQAQVSIRPWSDSYTNDEKIWKNLLLRSGCQLVGVLSSLRSSGQVLKVSGPVSAASPLLEEEKDSESISSASVTSSELLSLEKPPPSLSEDGDKVSPGLKVRSVLHESLTASGWSKKAVRRRHGTWDVFLLSPDLKILRNARELKIYVAKTGSIIDSNIINFSIPKITGTMESELTTLGINEDKDSSRSRRSIKMPSKFSDFKFTSDKKQSSPSKVSEVSPEEAGGIKIKSAVNSLPPLQVGSSRVGRWEAGVHVCPVCDKDCGFKQNLYFHLKKHEEDPSTPMSSEAPVKRGRGRPRKIREDSVDSSSGDTPGPVSISRPSLETPTVSAHVEAAQELAKSSGGQTKWRNGVPPPYWVWGRYICEVCKKDCGYMNNLGLHRKRTHGLSHRQDRLGYNGEIVRGTKINKSQPGRQSLEGPGPVRTIIIKRKLSMEEMGNTPVTSKKFVSKAMPCFECTACNNKDCMKCKWCHDKKKYGGPGRLNKRCITRRCTNPKIVETVDHLASRPRPPMKLVRLETTEGGQVMVQSITPAPVRTQYLSGGLVKAMPCRQCEACVRDDCGLCRACLDKKRFGGPGKMNKRCKLRQCITPKELGAASTVPTTYIRKQPGFVSSKFTQEDVKYIYSEDLEVEDLEEADNVADKFVETPTTKESLENFVEMGLDIGNGGSFARDISLTEFELTKSPVKPVRKTEEAVLSGVRTVPVPGNERMPASKCNVAVEFWQPGDTEDLEVTGTGLISSEAGSDLCFVCASSGLGPEDALVYCGGCCQSFHRFCVPGAEVTGEAGAWLCGQCVRCKVR